MEEVKFEDTQDAGLAEKAKELTVKVVGMAYDEAMKLIDDSGLAGRLASKDGEALGMTMDFRSDRVNLDVENDNVVAANVA